MHLFQSFIYLFILQFIIYPSLFTTNLTLITLILQLNQTNSALPISLFLDRNPSRLEAKFFFPFYEINNLSISININQSQIHISNNNFPIISSLKHH
jgi:hypothetical protein